MVLFDCDFKYIDNALVESNNIFGGEKLTQNIFEAGQALVWFLLGDAGLSSISDCLTGYLNVLAKKGIIYCDWVWEGSVNISEGGYVIMEKFIEEQGCSQAFIALSLLVLEGAVCAICDRLGVVSLEINIGIFDEYSMLGFFANNVWLM